MMTTTMAMTMTVAMTVTVFMSMALPPAAATGGRVYNSAAAHGRLKILDIVIWVGIPVHSAATVTRRRSVDDGLDMM